MKKKTIYRFVNLDNGKEYYGSTINDPQIRYKQHIYHATHPNDSKYFYPLYSSMRKHGFDKLKFEIVEQKECSELEIRQLEHEYIVSRNTLIPNGYNQTDDTISGPHTPEIDKKISETKRFKAKNVAEVDENNNILKIWRSIADCAEETLLDEKKIAAVCRGERRTTAGRRFYWIREDDELEIPEYNRDPYKGASGTTQVQSSSRMVAKIDIKTKEVLKIYPTCALAARENQCDASAISKVCRGKRKQCAGYIWEYVDDDTKEENE